MFIDKNGVVRMPKAYLAGTEIFYPNTLETQEKYHKLCEKYGIIGYYPSDPPPHGTNLKTMWQRTILPRKGTSIFYTRCKSHSQKRYNHSKLKPLQRRRQLGQRHGCGVWHCIRLGA